MVRSVSHTLGGGIVCNGHRLEIVEATQHTANSDINWKEPGSIKTAGSLSTDIILLYPVCSVRASQRSYS